MFQIHFSGDLAGKFKLAAASLDHLDAALKQFSKYLRQKTKERFAAEGPGWPGLAQSTDKRLAHSFTGKFTAHGSLRKSAVKAIERSIESGIKKGKIPMAARSKFKAILAGNLGNDNLALRVFGHTERKKKAKEMNAAEKIEAKLSKLQSQTQEQRTASLGKNRALKKHKMLGKLASTIKSSITGNTLTVYSSVEWAGVHNDGGTAGKGSRIPQRQFLKIDDQDLEVLATLVEGQITENL